MPTSTTHGRDRGLVSRFANPVKHRSTPCSSCDFFYARGDVIAGAVIHYGVASQALTERYLTSRARANHLETSTLGELNHYLTGAWSGEC